MPTELLSPAAARRRYVTVCVLFWLPAGLAIAPGILLFTERGMSLAAIAGFFAAHSLTVALLELPTGGLSDVIGRRTVLAAAGVFDCLAFALIGLGTSAWMLALGMALKGVGRALHSGPAEAWYVETVQAHSGPDADLRTGLARGSFATSAALAVATLLGGALPWLLGLGPDLGDRLSESTGGQIVALSVPALLASVMSLVFAVYVMTALPEKPRPRTTLGATLRGVPATVVGGLRLGGSDRIVRRVLLTAAAVGAALCAIELLMPGRAAEVTGAAESGAVLFAALACTGFVCSGLGSQCAPLAARLAGSGSRAVLFCLAVAGGGLVALAATAAASGAFPVVLAILGYCLVYIGLGAASPNQNDLLHRRVTNERRATALSVQSLALQLVGALAALVAGALPPGPLPWLVGAVALLLAAALWAARVPEDPGAVSADGAGTVPAHEAGAVPVGKQGVVPVGEKGPASTREAGAEPVQEL
uniref:MFS transporter n=1 Tax=Streptomyces polyasparticus TaxID=2767826 RepID=UPI00280BF343|nr:MFS transporter [Streptomyces polyasparticus]